MDKIPEKKVLLINPPGLKQTGFFCPPLGLLYLAGTLKDKGIDVKLIDGCISGWSGVGDKIRSYSPDIVGIPCHTSARKKSLAVAKMVKDINRNTIVVMGGAHPTIMYQQLLEHYDDVDIVVRGEGEIALLEIAQGIDLDKIDGIVYRDGANVIKNSERQYVDNLDMLPFPAWDIIADTLWEYPTVFPKEFKNYNGVDLSHGPRVSVIYSRGCKGHCDFCSSWWIWKKWRYRSAKNMVDELEWLYESFKIRHFCFADDALTMDRQAIIDLCDEIVKRNLNIAFSATTRSDCVDLEILEKLKQAGCYEVAYGIETVSPKLLSRMNKENNIHNAETAIVLTKRAGLKPGALLIVGNVGETEETIDETIDFLEKFDVGSIGVVGGLWIFPGTGLYRHAKKLGIIDDNFWLGNEPYMVYTHEHSLRRLRFFTHAIRNRKKLSEMTFKYRLIYVLRTYIGGFEQKALSIISKYPVIDRVVSGLYPAVRRNVSRIVRSLEG
ncbi:MAG: cobalamin B12-binding domain-containing protein [Candidatus Brocadiales bacterium]|nr:cobalamin B12-binding domain-containing protein [Candidatus Brocadiales bacterium]